MDKIVAIVLAAGLGKRMNSKSPKQYMEINNYPVLYYTLKAFEESSVDEIILVVGEEEEEERRKQFEPYRFSKLKKVTAGGRERYHSVYCGLKAATGADYVLIHDGARPMVTPLLINKIITETKCKKACIAAVKAKDTIKVADISGIVTSTPNRDSLWLVQTPQAFDYRLIYNAYKELIGRGIDTATDDAMVLERITGHPIYIIESDYKNIKITTWEDLQIVELFLKDS